MVKSNECYSVRSVPKMQSKWMGESRQFLLFVQAHKLKKTCLIYTSPWNKYFLFPVNISKEVLKSDD